ncbi:MAG: hypothetical protein MUQ56_03510 [Thermoleophilia bacterium]|nr:hypothetical protein [Thermoleophilia bacterium]
MRRPRREDTLPETAPSLFDDDPALGLLAQELGELGGLELSGAPRERILALLRQEVRAQEARGAFSGGSRSTFSRVALGGAALLMAASLGLFALAGGLGSGDRMAGSSSTSDTLVAEGGTTTDTQSPDTTGVSVPGTVTSQPPVTIVPTTTPVTDNTATTDDRPVPTSPPSSARPRTTTTVAPGTTTTTTGGAVMTWEDREDSARTVVLSLADKIMTDTLAGVDAYVTSGAKSALAQMIASLERPSSARIVAVKDTSSGARVLLEMTDNVSDGQGDLEEVHRRFYFETRADENGALITAIYAGPAE